MKYYFYKQIADYGNWHTYILLNEDSTKGYAFSSIHRLKTIIDTFDITGSEWNPQFNKDYLLNKSIDGIKIYEIVASSSNLEDLRLKIKQLYPELFI